MLFSKLFRISFNSSLEIIKVVVPEQCIFFWNPAWIAEAAGVIANGTKIFFAIGTATFINGPTNLLNDAPKNPPDWIILDLWALDSSIKMTVLAHF